MRQISWKQLLGNPYRYGLNALMLLPDGYKHEAVVCAVGDAKSAIPAATIITFDEKYVISYLCNFIVKKLRPATYNDLERIIHKAWKEYETNKQ